MSLWDFIELMEQNCYASKSKDTYFIYLNELRMRKIESISEGGNYKLISLAKELHREFEKEISNNKEFVNEEELNEFEFIIKEICH